MRKRRVGVVASLACLVLFSTSVWGQLCPEDVLILVNENSPTSRYVARLYRQYHPEISESQVLYLSGLTDCSGPSSTAADEIITRGQYNQLIAGPVRDYLADSNYPERITEIKVIITTAGMPYRIEDTDPSYANAIYPGGSSPGIIANNLSRVDVASVESELSCLWYSDYGSDPFGLENRMVNVYQGYRQSSISLFERLVPGTKQMNWTTAFNNIGVAPKIEGENDWFFPEPPIYGAYDRSFNVGDIYLICRLDGPKEQGKSAVYSVRAILERARRASDPAIGINPAQAVVVLDDAPSKGYDRNRIYNLDGSVNYIVYAPDVNQPPDARTILTKNDYLETFTALTNEQVDMEGLSIGLMDCGGDLAVMLDRRAGWCTSQAELEDYAATDPCRADEQGIILLATYGTNGDEGSTSSYLLEGGPGATALFNVVNGAVFTSIESFNAVTMFSDVTTGPVAQGKIVDFIKIGGAGAIGHSFEPMSEAIADNLYLHYNLLADEDGDNIADLSFVEAAFTAIPYLSWSEVVIGDPLMQIAYGPGGKVWTPLTGDANNDGIVNYGDMMFIRVHLSGRLNTINAAQFELYHDLCDVNKDGIINYGDMMFTRVHLGARADW